MLSKEAAESLSTSSFLVPRNIVESAWLEHAPFAFWLMEAIRPKMFVELGTHAGFSFLAFCQAVQHLGLPTACYAIDTWEGDDHAGFYGEQVYASLSTIQFQYSAFSRLIRARFDEALHQFSEAEIDLLHIDGRHGYDDVVEDYTSWKPKLSSRAVVLFHDINVRERDFGVWRLWEELREQHPSFEFIHGHGLGVLCPGAIVPETLRSLFESREAARTEIQLVYSRLGASISTQYLLGHAHATLGARDAAAAQSQEQLRQLQLQHEAVTQGEASLRSEVASRDDLIGQLQQQLQEVRQHLQTQSESEAKLLGELQERARSEAKLLGELQQVQRESQERAEIEAKLRGEVAARDWALTKSQLELQQAHRQSEAQSESDAKSREATAFRDMEFSQLQQQIEAHAQNEARLIDELTAVRSSTTWRALHVVRSIGSHVSPPIRGRLRRAAKALYWTATPHRLPERLRFLRARKAASQLPPSISQLPPSIALDAPPPASALAEHGLRAYIAYEPASEALTETHSDANHVLDGAYSLSTESPGYVYVPRRRPDDLEQTIKALVTLPTFSVVAPLYNTPSSLLESMVRSVTEQWYPHWELILVDDCSSHQSVRDALTKLTDPRIKITLLDKNKGISGATNEALARAKGDYVVFLDHDDELTNDCLFELAQCIASEDPDYIYSDEDKIGPDGGFTQPFFKPDWSPDTIMSTMYTCHVSCVRRSLIDTVGGLRSEFDGSQDWDFVLRVTEVAKRILHIPRVLYHWRVIPASVSSSPNAKPYAIDAARRTRVAALERRGLSGSVVPVPQIPSYFRVKYEVQGTPLISIIIPTKNNGSVLRRCLESIFLQTTYSTFEIVLLDNGSTEAETVAYMNSLLPNERIKIIRHDAPFNFSELNNIGSRVAKGSILLFLNDDTEVLSRSWLQDMIGYAQLPHIGAVGAKLLYPNGRSVQHSGIVNLAAGPNHAFLQRDADDPCYFARNLLEYNWLAVTGACMMVERHKFDAAGGFDENFPIAYNDVDLCFRLVDGGLYNIVCPAVELTHHESLSRGLDHTDDKRRRLEREKDRLYRKHPHYFMHDPFYNPNLAPDDLYFGIASA